MQGERQFPRTKAKNRLTASVYDEGFPVRLRLRRLRDFGLQSIKVSEGAGQINSQEDNGGLFVEEARPFRKIAADAASVHESVRLSDELQRHSLILLHRESWLQRRAADPLSLPLGR